MLIAVPSFDLDEAALRLAMSRARIDPDRSKQLDRMLATGRSRQEVAQYAAYVCQMDSLHLRPWEDPPCWCDSVDEGPGARLLVQMVENDISPWHPDPLTAVERAKAAKAKS